ncbi:MAG TPA: deoxyribose-phosphate aldolase [Oscillospiraceae bacterium]|mgnify:FL=1|nr:deoxyribose-phosphate aldolase [Oscillospiraceae bacterium]HXK78470.1 deoxyribose-phosphate aldolase [Oscillospiraceae bacterium]
MERSELAKRIDHTMLKPDATHADLHALCDEAKKYGVASVCVNSLNVWFVHKELAGTGIRTCSVVGFPLGAMASAAKSFEASCAVEDGAEEIDMVMDIASAKAGNWRKVKEDIEDVLDACEESGGALLKVILECCLLTDEEKREACRIAKEAGADFVKTSTGFAKGGATVEDVRLLREAVGPEMGVKAAGGIRDFETACAMVEAGASRIGTSAAARILGDEA